MKMTRSFLLCVLSGFLFSGTQARAQSLEDLFRIGCSGLGSTPGYEWICKAGDLANQVGELITGFHEDFVGFGRDLFDAWIEDALASIAENTGLAELNGYFGQLDAALADGPRAFREAVSKVIGELRLSNRLNRQNPQALIERLKDPDRELRNYSDLYDIAVQTNPNAVAADGMLNSRQDQLLETRAEASAVHDLNTKLAQQVADATKMRDAAAQVLAPSVGGAGGGDAAQLADAARTAVSSRAAIQVLTEGLANLMRQQATFSSDISENLRVLTQQQVMTTWELQLAINTLTEQMDAEVAKEKAELEAQLAREYDVGTELAESLRNTAAGTAVVLAPDLDTLEFGALGW